MASAEAKTIINDLRGSPYTADKSVELLRKESGSKTERPLPDGGSHESVDAGGVPSEWVEVPGSRADYAFLYIHGGGYYRGSARSSRSGAGWIAEAAASRVLSIDYRLAPEHPFPAAIEDTHAAYRWLLDEGFDAKRIVVGGVSAGGGLSLALLLAVRDAGDPMPAGAVPMSAWMDLAQTGETFRTNAASDPSVSKEYLDRFAGIYLNGTDARNPLASPLYGDLRSLPKILMQVGALETMLDDSRVFAERAREAGVDVTLEEWPGMFHGWQSQAYRLPEARDAVARIGEFCREVSD